MRKRKGNRIDCISSMNISSAPDNNVSKNLLKTLLIPLLLMPGLSDLKGAEPPKPIEAKRPNIIYILADDLGYGDVHCLNPEGKILTPNMDRIAREGMTFTDAHSSSAVCTPSRYSILTGRYCWRSNLQKGVLFDLWNVKHGPNGPVLSVTKKAEPLIAPDQLTVGGFLQKEGYQTACIGKWHLGLDLPDMKDWEQPIKNGPTTRGFDYYFGVTGSLDMAPFVFVENDRLTENPSTTKKWSREGPAAPDFEAVQALPKLTAKSVEYLEGRKKAGGPFFLYLALTSPHTPVVPSAEWKGKSGIGDYGDFVMETDWAVGEVLAAVDRLGLAKDTLFIFTSDNGASPFRSAADMEGLAKRGHHVSGPFRGAKSDIWDGGHRMPFLVRWPGHIEAGSKCDQTVCLGDLIATVADLLATKLPDNAGPDSVSILPALLGKATKPLREYNVYHSYNGNFAIQEGKWKLELCPGSGGWGKPLDKDAVKQKLPEVQLYDMSTDIGERRNVQAEHPEIVQHLIKVLEKCVSEGRSTPGPRLNNDVPVDIWKKQDMERQEPEKKKTKKQVSAPAAAGSALGTTD